MAAIAVAAVTVAAAAVLCEASSMTRDALLSYSKEKVTRSRLTLLVSSAFPLSVINDWIRVRHASLTCRMNGQSCESRRREQSCVYNERYTAKMLTKFAKLELMSTVPEKEA